MQALGMIELYGWVSAVEALDAALKAADVKTQSFTRVHGGLVTVMVTGEVAAVQAAVDAAAHSAQRVGQVLSVHVIPRPIDELEGILDEPESTAAPKQKKPAPKPETADTPKAPRLEQKPKAVKTQTSADAPTMEELEALSVVKLRAAARDMGLTTLSKREIRDAKRDELLEAIRKFREQEV